MKPRPSLRDVVWRSPVFTFNKRPEERRTAGSGASEEVHPHMGAGGPRWRAKSPGKEAEATEKTAKTAGRAETARDKQRDEIYYTQIVVITAMVVFATGFLAAARVLVPAAGTAAWISVLIGGALGLGIAALAG